MTLAPGTRVGPYEVVAPLGAGGMGEVYRARDPRLGREVAIKALPAAFARDAERRGRFEREAKTLASLNHPGIAAIYGLEEVAGLPYLVLELVEGETLAERLRRGAVPPREALQLALQVAAAIEAAHERGVVHRDLKPGNVMISASGVVKVLDFGLAKSDPGPARAVDVSDSPTMTAMAGATVAGVILGTAAYMSPEQARGKPVDRRSDVWSFGCLVYECLAAHAAFRGETVSDLIAHVLEREPDWASLPAETPARLVAILRRCLRKDPEERPRDIRDVRLELGEIAAAGGRGEATRQKSVAVLPFDNLSGPDDEYFADGVTEEIMNALAQLEDLRVAARSSCFAFKGRREDLRAIGEKLEVATVLEGSVRRAGPRLRITVQLVNAADGYQLWSERYDREMTDVFAVQDEIAGAIAARLKVTLHGDVERARTRRGTASLEAYELFLRGRALQIRRGRSIAEAIRCFERALALDPRYAEALAWLSDSYRLMGTYGAAPFGEVMPKAKAAVQRALEIDPNLAEAYATLADVEAQYDRDIARARASWARALEIDPRHTRARCERALWSFGLAAITADDAVEETRLAVGYDPLDAWAAGMHCFMLNFARRAEEAIREAERAVALDPDSFWANYNLFRAHAWTGGHARAQELAPALLATSGRHPWVLGELSRIGARTDRRDVARAIYDELEARSRWEFIAPFWLAAAADASGLRDLALQYAERAVSERDPLLALARVMPTWEGIRSDSRFADLTRGVWR